jgi:hypothetical protein
MLKILGMVVIASIACFGVALVSIAFDNLVDVGLAVIERVFHKGQI